MSTATSTKITPLGDRVVVKALEQEEKTRSGIVLPDTAKEKPQEGEVVAVGEGRTLDSGEKVSVVRGARPAHSLCEVRRHRGKAG